MKLLSVPAAGLPAMTLRPIARFPLRRIAFSGPILSSSKTLNLTLLNKLRAKPKLCSTWTGAAEGWRMSLRLLVLSLKSSNLDRYVVRQPISTVTACSALETPTIELPQKKAPRLRRKRTTKLKDPAPSLDAQQNSALQVSVPQGSAWTKVELWVVFSDLHFSRRTRDTCLQVLEAVHQEASVRKAGIIFLGDFWHARGALPVELLNVVITELAKWTCPAVFIPGNHDQVNMGGQMHALMVLGAVNPLIKVFDDPVEFLGALWLPFRRDHNMIKQALEQHPNVKAIFAHLDVVGAFMNEAFQAKDGIEPTFFPPNIPVFTGHYHKPHVVKDTQIEYIGSPYQVSASETGQAKRFVLLNNLWQKVGQIAIDVGGRHFVSSDTEEFSLEKVESLRSGDHLRLLLSSMLLQEPIKANMVSPAAAF